MAPGSWLWATLSDLCSGLMAQLGLKGQGQPPGPLVSWLVPEGLSWDCLSPLPVVVTLQQPSSGLPTRRQGSQRAGAEAPRS